MDYSGLRASAALTPEEQAKSDAFEHSDGNRRELEMAIATERDPAKLAVLRQAFAQTFEGAPRAPDARPTPAAPDDPFAAYDQKYSAGGALPMKTSAAASSDDPFAAYDAKYGNPQPAPPEGSDFVRGFKVATGQTMPLVKGTLGLVGATGENVFGEGGVWSGLKNWGLTGYQQGMQALQPLAKDTDELTTAYAKAKTGDFGALVDWASYGLGYSLSQLLQAAGTSVVGGVAGTLTAGPAGGVAGAVGGAVEGGAVRATAQRFLAPLVAAEIKKLGATTAGKDLSADALKRVAIANVAKNAGQTAALIGYAGVQEAGSIYPSAEEQAAKEGRKLDGADLARVWATSAGAAAIEGLTDKLGLDALTGKIHLPGAGGRAARGVIGGAIGAGTEAATEGAQTFLERVGAGQSLADDDALKDYINSAGLGAIGGGPVGAISGALHAHTAQEHKEAADKQFKAASDRLGTATDVGDMIAAADDMTRRPNGDIQVTLPKIDQQTKLDQMLDDPAYQKAQDARLKKLQEAVDLHSSLVEAQNTQTPPVTLGDGTVSSPNTPAVEGALVGRQDTTQLPEVQQTPLMQGRYVGPLRDQATDEARQAAGMPTAEESRTSMPSTVPNSGTSAPNSGTPIAGITAPTTPVTEAPGAPMTGLSTAREQPISASSPNKYRGNTRFADLTPMSQQQAESRLEVLQDSATRKGNDPKALQIVPHPGSAGKFAIKNMTPPEGKLSTEQRAPAQDATQMGPQVIDPAEAYVKAKRAENTPAARAFIQAYDAGRISRNDVLRAAAADAKRRSNTQIAAESRGLVPPDEPGKARGEAVSRDMETGRTLPGNPVDAYVNSQRIAAQTELADDASDEAKAKHAEAKAFVESWDKGDITREQVREKLTKQQTDMGQRPKHDGGGFTPVPKMTDRRGPKDETGDKGEGGGKPPTGTGTTITDTGPTGEGGEFDKGDMQSPPKSRDEFVTRMPIDVEPGKEQKGSNKELRAAVKSKDLAKVLDVLEKSGNPIIRHLAKLSRPLVGEVRVVDRPDGKKWENSNAAGAYWPRMDAFGIHPQYAGSEWTVAHELMHALLYRAIKYPSAGQKELVKRLGDLLKHVQKTIEAPTDPDYDYGINWLFPKRAKEGYTFNDQLHEFASEGLSNPWLQYRLSKIKMPGTTALSTFVRYIARLLGFKETNALSEFLNITEQLAQMGRTKGVNQRRKALVNQREYSSGHESLSQEITSEAGSADVRGSDQRGLLVREADSSAGPVPGAPYARSTAASGSAAAEYVRGTGAAVPGQPRARVTALGIAERIERVGSQALVGQQVRSAEDLASLAQVYRDPRYETMRVFFTKGDAIVHATGVSARMPGFAPMIPAGWSEQQYFDWFRGQMTHTGADGYYLLHNHPSGNPTPSRADSAMTAKISGEVPGFKAHVVINSNRYAVMTEPLPGMQTADVVEKDFGPDMLLQASKPSPVLGKMITGSGDLVSLGKSFQKANYVTIIGRGADGAVRMTAEAPSTILGRDPKALIGTARALMRKSGSADLFLVGSASDVASTPVKEAMRVGILRDAVSDSGQSAAEQGADISGGKLLNSTPAHSVAEEQFGPHYSRLAGRTVAYPVAVQETGETATVTTDAQQLMRDYDGRIAAMTKLLKCLG